MGRISALLRALLFLMLGAVGQAIGAPLAQKYFGSLNAAAIGALGSGVAFVLSMLFVRWDGISLRDVGVAPGRESIARCGAGFLCGVLLMLLYLAILRVFGRVHWTHVQTVNVSDVVITFGTYLLLATREELGFHGYPLRRLSMRYGIWPALLLIAFVFAAEHVAGGASWATALAGAGIGSLLFGMASIATRGIAVPLGLHAAWNFGDWLRGGKDATGPWRMDIAPGYEQQADWSAWVGYIAIMLGATAVFWLWYRRVGERVAVRLNDQE